MFHQPKRCLFVFLPLLFCCYNLELGPLNVTNSERGSRSLFRELTGSVVSAYPRAIPHHSTSEAGMLSSLASSWDQLAHASCRQVASPASSASRHRLWMNIPTCPHPLRSTILSTVTNRPTGAPKKRKFLSSTSARALASFLSMPIKRNISNANRRLLSKYPALDFKNKNKNEL